MWPSGPITHLLPSPLTAWSINKTTAVNGRWWREHSSGQVKSIVSSGNIKGRVCVRVFVRVFSYLVEVALVTTWAECRDNTHTFSVSVKPLLTDAALDKVATVGRRGVNVPATPLTQRDLCSYIHPPLLPCRTRCRGTKKAFGWFDINLKTQKNAYI